RTRIGRMIFHMTSSWCLADATSLAQARGVVKHIPGDLDSLGVESRGVVAQGCGDVVCRNLEAGILGGRRVTCEQSCQFRVTVGVVCGVVHESDLVTKLVAHDVTDLGVKRLVVAGVEVCRGAEQ